MKKVRISMIMMAALVAAAACSEDVTIYRTAPDTSFEASATTVERGTTVQFTDKSTSVSGATLESWEWNFDFGNEDNVSSFSTLQNPSWTFDEVGTFTVRLVVTDSYGSFSSAMQTVTVEIPYSEQAHAAFSITEGTLNINVPIEFTDASVPASGASITSWEWDFGESNESVSSQQNPSWTYTTSGSFTIALTVTDSYGNVSTAKQDLLIMDPSDLVNIVWKTALSGSIQNTVSPALSSDGETVYMWADQSATDAYDVALKAYNTSTGEVRWSYDLTTALSALNSNGGVRQVFASPSVGTNGDIYLCARDLRNSGTARKSYMFAVKSDGTQRWAYPLGLDGNFNYMTPAVDASGNVYLGHLTNSPFQIAVVDPSTGSASKTISLDLGVRSGISLDSSGNVYFCSTGTNGLFSYSSSSLTMNWQYNTNVSTTGGDITVGSDGTIYTVIAGSSNGIVAAISSTGSQIWEYNLPSDAQYGGVVIGADGTVYANGGKVSLSKESGGVVALNSTDGTLKWHYATSEDVNNCVPLVDDRGYVHFITDKGTYYVITDEGLLYGMKSLGTQSYSSPVMDSSGKVYIGVQDDSGASYVICLDTGATGYADSAWPMKGQNPQRTHLQK